MKPKIEKYIIRMKDEARQLNLKVKKLEDFIKSDKYIQLDAEEQNLLMHQYEAMSVYAAILHRRIARKEERNDRPRISEERGSV